MTRSIIFIVGTLGWLLAQSQDARINSQLLSYEFIENSLQMTEEYSITILNEKGKQFGTFYDYYDKGRKIKSVSFELLDKNGNKVKKYTKTDALDVSFNKSYEVDDTRRLIIDPDYGIYPYTVNVKVSSESRWLISTGPWIPRPYFEIEVVESKFQITYPKDKRIKIRQQNTPDPVITENTGLSTITKSWTMANLPAVSKDMDYRHFVTEQPAVFVVSDDFVYDGFVGDQSSWQALGDWFVDLNKGRDVLNQETKNFLDALPRENVRDAIREVYFYMQDRTRYVSIQLGIGGFQAIQADVVDKTGYGDCKALTNYMKAMLTYLKIPSNYVLVKAGESVPDLYVDFPSNQFNHVFLGVPLQLDTIYLECTSQNAPFNYLGSFTDDRFVLWCAKGSSKMIRTPVYKEDYNVRVTNSSIALDPHGNATISLEEENNGYFFDDYNYYLYFNSDRLKDYHYGKFSFKDFTISEYKINDPGREVPTYKATFDLLVNTLAGKAGENMITPIYPLNGIEEYIAADQYRKHGEVSRGFTLIDKIEVTLPEGFFIDNLPADLSLNSDYGKYTLTTIRENEKLIVKRELVMKKGTYDQEKFIAFYQFVKKVKAGDNRKLLISSKT